MQTHVRNVVFAFAAGVLVTLAIRHVADRDEGVESPRVTLNEADAVAAPVAPASAPASIDRGNPVTSDSLVATNSAASAGEPEGVPATSTVRTAQQPPIPPAVLTDDIKARPAPLNGLLDASSLRCDIGVAQGANWSQGKASLHAISYQGGPFYFESIDPEAGTATMSGGSGVTGSMSGELEMRATAGNKGLTFSAFTRYGDLLIVTVYPALDSRGQYRTVMTTFGDRFDHETAQFFGGCDVSLSKH